MSTRSLKRFVHQKWPRCCKEQSSREKGWAWTSQSRSHQSSAVHTTDARFHKMLATDELRAWYGPEHVALAVDRGAVGTLLISDDLFRYVRISPSFVTEPAKTDTVRRSSDPVTRNRYVEMVEAVRSRGGESLIFSSMHESGQQLNLVTGIAAILTYPLDVEIVEMEEREAKEDAAKAAREKAAEDAEGGSD